MIDPPKCGGSKRVAGPLGFEPRPSRLTAGRPASWTLRVPPGRTAQGKPENSRKWSPRHGGCRASRGLKGRYSAHLSYEAVASELACQCTKQWSAVRDLNPRLGIGNAAYCRYTNRAWCRRLESNQHTALIRRGPLLGYKPSVFPLDDAGEVVGKLGIEPRPRPSDDRMLPLHHFPMAALAGNDPASPA